MKKAILLEAMEDGAHTAVDYLTPYVERALREGGEAAERTSKKLRPALHDARVRGARLAAETLDRVQPALDDALDRVSPTVEATLDRVRPVLDDAFRRIPTSVAHAREVVQEDVLPHLARTLREVAALPLAKDIKVAAASAALAKELDRVAGKKRGSAWGVVGKILLIGGAIGAVALAVRKFLAPAQTGGWTSPAADTAFVADPVADVVSEPADKATGEPTPADIEEKLDKLAEEASTPESAPLSSSPYGEGSYVGAKPPKGFNIKGNDRSMKYHVPGSQAYERTSAQVWFSSEEAAQAAGFTRPQR